MNSAIKDKPNAGYLLRLPIAGTTSPYGISLLNEALITKNKTQRNSF